ncbi:hypothetical protein FQN57_003411 [Myotisia sp. PD_48]|nr:hypothetical protein FQN57_003411 [Myotisia sp. PD_48]
MSLLQPTDEVRSPSLDYRDSFNIDEPDLGSQEHLLLDPWGYSALSNRAASILPWRRRRPYNSRNAVAWNRNSRRRRWRLFTYLRRFFVILISFILLVALFRPSYTKRPRHYNLLRNQALISEKPGRGNPRNEKVFIATSIFDPDGKLAYGQWSQNLFDLIDLLGPENTFLSIYENDSGDQTITALDYIKKHTACNHSLVYDPHLDTTDLQHITLEDGSTRVKRIAYLAEARNRALRPLDTPMETKFDKLLYVNDVYFKPIDAIQLLFSTNVDKDGIAQYRAACAVDFINPFKFYDNFASRDLEGYSMGLPFFPWFTNSGAAESRKDVLKQKDAVRVRSCWGGMIAFDARFFQATSDQVISSSNNNTTDFSQQRKPVRFRAEPEIYWDASECCLVNADIQIPPEKSSDPIDTGIYMNPYIRVAYKDSTLSWLWFTRRFERLYSIPHNILNHLVGLPWKNTRRTEHSGDQIEDSYWASNDDGSSSYQASTRVAGTGGFCGRRALQVMKLHPKAGEKNWEMIPIPTS